MVSQFLTIYKRVTKSLKKQKRKSQIVWEWGRENVPTKIIRHWNDNLYFVQKDKIPNGASLF
jgi:hypothetical protein